MTDQDVTERAGTIVADRQAGIEADALEQAQREQNDAQAAVIAEADRDRLRKAAAEALAPKIDIDGKINRQLVGLLKLLAEQIPLRVAARQAVIAAMRAGCADVRYSPYLPPDGPDLRALGFANGHLETPDGLVQLTAVREYFADALADAAPTTRRATYHEPVSRQE